MRQQLLDTHWSYLDGYATELISRGPTFGGDGDTPTGSVHIVDLPDPVAARAFAFDEPYYRAGVYRDAANALRAYPPTPVCRLQPRLEPGFASTWQLKFRSATAGIVLAHRWPAC